MKTSRLAVTLAIAGLGTSALSSGAVAQNPIAAAPMELAQNQASAVDGVTISVARDKPLEAHNTPFPTMLSKMLMPFGEPKAIIDREAARAAALDGIISGKTTQVAGLAIPDDLLELASVYRATATGLAATPTLFHSAAEVRAVVKSTAAYEPDQLQEGMVAYGALVALRSPEFVASVRAKAASKGWSDVLAEYMAIDAASLDVPNMDKAAGLVITALDQLGAQVAIQGYAVKQAAYDTQLSPWSLVKVSDSSARLNLTKSLSTQKAQGQPEDMAQLRRLVTGEEEDASIPGAPVAGPYKPAVAKSLALAAMIIAGKAGADNADAVKKVLDDPDTDLCIAQAKTTLYECFSVAGPHYEDIFCGGQHAMIDTGMCMIKAAGATQTAFVEPAHRPAHKVDGGKTIVAKASPKAGSKGAKKKPTKLASN